MNKYIGIEEADKIIFDLCMKNGLVTSGNSWRYWLRHRNRTENTIDIADVVVPFVTVGRKICVNKQEFLKFVEKDIREKLQSKYEYEHGPIEKRGTVIGNFVELSRWDSGMTESYYVCRKCKKTASTKLEKTEYAGCSDGNADGGYTVSHLVCNTCGIVQAV